MTDTPEFHVFSPRQGISSLGLLSSGCLGEAANVPMIAVR